MTLSLSSFLLKSVRLSHKVSSTFPITFGFQIIFVLRRYFDQDEEKRRRRKREREREREEDEGGGGVTSRLSSLNERKTRGLLQTSVEANATPSLSIFLSLSLSLYSSACSLGQGHEKRAPRPFQFEFDFRFNSEISTPLSWENTPRDTKTFFFFFFFFFFFRDLDVSGKRLPHLFSAVSAQNDL